MQSSRFLALGDSYTIGEAVDPADRWPSQLAGRLRLQGFSVEEPVIVAKTGWTTDELDAAIDAAGLAGPFDLVSLLIGVNNQYRERDPAEYRTQFAHLLRRAIAFAGTDPRKVVVVSIPDWGVTPFAREHGRHAERVAAEIDLFNSLSREESLSAGTHYVDITAGSRRAATDLSLLAPDGLHPSAKMYAEWVDAIEPIAKSVLAGGR